jgi:hypothetical protein
MLSADFVGSVYILNDILTHLTIKQAELFNFNAMLYVKNSEGLDLTQLT